MKKLESFRKLTLCLVKTMCIGYISFTAVSATAQQQSKGTTVTDEVQDRIAIKELVDAYAHDADRRQTEAQANLFTPDGFIEVYQGEPSAANKPTAIIKGYKALTAGFAVLKNYDVTMHFNGQTDIKMQGDTATGETYCLAHHIWKENNQRMLMVMGIRYYDTFVRIRGKWLFARRKLIFDWTDKRPSNPQ